VGIVVHVAKRATVCLASCFAKIVWKISFAIQEERKTQRANNVLKVQPAKILDKTQKTQQQQPVFHLALTDNNIVNTHK
jgi:hypothetical protein